MSTCKDCLHYEVCDRYTAPNETYPEVGGCRCFKPKADYVEVKYGKWLKTTEPLGYRDVDCIECSVCHDSWVVDEDFDFDDCKENWSFCPNCGAKMKGGAE